MSSNHGVRHTEAMTALRAVFPQKLPSIGDVRRLLGVDAATARSLISALRQERGTTDLREDQPDLDLVADEMRTIAASFSRLAGLLGKSTGAEDQYADLRQAREGQYLASVRAAYPEGQVRWGDVDDALRATFPDLSMSKSRTTRVRNRINAERGFHEQATG
jgi:hypothetical protein